MLALALSFPAGRYHANPWDRHVNEAAVAWPPEPWRVLRALIATWHAKVKPLGKHEDQLLTALLEALTQALPVYNLPPVSHSHTRHYMPIGAAKSLIFDGFVAIAPGDRVIMAWPDIELPSDQLDLLDELLAVMGYLGRAESWVDVVRFQGEFTPNCRPGSEPRIGPFGEPIEEAVPVLAPLPAGAYAEFRTQYLATNKNAKRLAPTLPNNLVDALSLETAALRKPGWSQAPASRKELYLRPANALGVQRRNRSHTVPAATTARYLLIGKPLPRLEEAVRIGDMFRRAVMSEAKRLLGEGSIPSVFSGHGLPPHNRHRHAFYLPWDDNRDGRIDRLILHLPDGMNEDALRIIERLGRLYSRSGGEWRLVLENIGRTEVGGPSFALSSAWISITPYLHPWHTKRGFDISAQIRRECTLRGIPEPIDLQQLPSVLVGTRARGPVHFRRFREKSDSQQPDHQGSFWRLRFARPVAGPLALGFGCHFGLGMFRPDRQLAQRLRTGPADGSAGTIESADHGTDNQV